MSCLDGLAFVRHEVLRKAQYTKNLMNSEAALVSKVVAKFQFSQRVRTRVCSQTSNLLIHISFQGPVKLALVRGLVFSYRLVLISK